MVKIPAIVQKARLTGPEQGELGMSLQTKEADPNYVYNDYDSKPDPTHRPMYLAPTLDFLRRDKSIKRVLDAGCGGGDFTEGLAPAGYEVYGFDLNESAIRAAQKRGTGTFVVASIYDDFRPPFGIDSFDAIVCVEVIEHLYNPRIFVTRAKEALRPGGMLIITTPYWGYLKNVMLAVTDRMDRSLTALWDGGHIKHWSRRTLTLLLTEQGFEEIGFVGCGEGVRAHTPYLWNGMLMAFRKPL